MYIESVTSDQIQRYVKTCSDLLANQNRTTNAGPCADMVLNVIENASHSQIIELDAVFNNCLAMIERGTLLGDFNDVLRCRPGDILAVVRNDGEANRNVVHYMLYVGDIQVNDNNQQFVINTVGINGAFPNNSVILPYHKAVGIYINPNNFINGQFLYDEKGNYSLYCIKYGLI